MAQVNKAAREDPPANVPRTQAIGAECTAGPDQQCQSAVVQAIDQARHAEGVGPLALPSYYTRLTVAQQVFVLANLERVARGLPGFAGLSSQLDALSLSGATADTDPAGPPDVDWGSNWAGGEASALLADYDWMYDDGPGSPNLDCTSPGANGCWDHRRNTLGDYGLRPSMGAGATRVNGVTSMTELFSSGPVGHLDYALPVATFAVSAYARHGYWEVGGDGSVSAHAGGGFRGSAAGVRLAQPVVGMAVTPNGGGYWEVAADGGVFSFGNARFFGSAAGRHLKQPVVGMAAASDGQGYWLVTGDGCIYSFGAVRYYGAPAGIAGAGIAGGNVIGISATPDGRGYWLVTKYGHVYAFGDARPYGPTLGVRPSAPVVGMAVTRDGRGYWLVTDNGQIYAFGDAKYSGSVTGGPRADSVGTASIGAASIGAKIVGMATSAVGPGYYVIEANGTVISFGGAQVGAGAPPTLNKVPAVGMATA